MNSPLSLTQLVNLAIGSPEVGAVNFTALQQLLHAIVRKLNIHHTDKGFESPDAPASGKLAKISDAESFDTQEVLLHEVSQENLESDLSSRASHHLNEGNGEEESAKTDPRCIASMWQYLLLSKKVEANESGIKAVSYFRLIKVFVGVLTNEHQLFYSVCTGHGFVARSF